MTITYVDYGNIWVCVDCYFAHHYGYREVDREATDDEEHAWHGGYLRGHDLPNVVEETEHGLLIREWFAGESDTPSDREPLGEIPDGLEVADNTCSNHNGTDETECSECGHTGYEDGLDDFSRRRCEGCGSTLGGSRSRLHLSKREPT